ncbi:hypothetical protein Golob_003909 [Gossypium lobatum]|uniref:Uncharacterized protein n=1 Tax=Gossypium lobatum TaxID=34289 RepID=A0A7J8MZW6_9ROSI|nr:hypothetical protein [Gossypium lobatum]
MFMGVVATGDKAWARSSGTLPSECFKDVDSDMLDENEEENVINDVYISNDVISMVDNSSSDESDDEREKKKFYKA